VLQLCICVKIVEDVHHASKPLHHLKFIAQDNSPVAVADDNRKQQAQKALPSRHKIRTRKSDSAVILQRDKPSSSSRASMGDANVARHYKASSKVGRGEEDSITYLSAERKRLEKENKEKKRRLEELKKQEMLIEAAAKKGGGAVLFAE